jgi:putative IMPACT (imprinted ancient) family translation regulator
MCAERMIEVDYTGIDGVQKYLAAHACTLLGTDYGTAVRFTVAVKKAEADGFCAGLVDYMQGRVKIEKGDEYYAPFRE